MCRTTDTIAPLVSMLEDQLPKFKKNQARELIAEHKRSGSGQSSEVAIVAEWLFKSRKKFAIDDRLRAIGGTGMQKSALREAVMMILHKRAHMPYEEPTVVKPAPIRRTTVQVIKVNQPVAVLS